jgi:cobalt-zinc-cadmium efflux system membrane fusion protein
MNLFRTIALLPLLTLPLLLACHRKIADHGHDHDHDGHDHAITGAVSGSHGDYSHDHSQTTPLSEVPGTRTLVVAPSSELSIWLPAEVVADESSQFVLSSPVSGILGALLVTPGRLVDAGAPLAEVKSPELARLYADLLASKAKLARAEATLAREKRLDAKKATSQRDLEEAESEALVAKAEEESARLILESLGSKAEQGGATWVLRAPRTGSVVEYRVISGQGVSAGQELGFFLATGSVIVRLELSQAMSREWNRGHAFVVRHSNGSQWQGKLEGIVPALSPNTMRQSYRLRLAGNSLPLPGAPVEVQIPFPQSIAVPQVALQQVDGLWGVFVVEQGHAEFRPVVRGQDIKGDVIILDGIKPGETVVAEGAYLLKAYQRKLAHPDEEDGHAH